MPIGVVNDDDFNKELEGGRRSPTPDLRPAQVIDINRGGRSEGDLNVPQVIRDIIVDESVQNGRAAAIEFAKGFGVSPSSVSAYSNGANSTSTYNTPATKTNNSLREARLRVARKARRVLSNTIENITEEKLSEAPLKDLALVAKAMSGVIKDMDPPEDNNNGGNTFNGPSIVMFNPGFTKESNFETVEVDT